MSQPVHIGSVLTPRTKDQGNLNSLVPRRTQRDTDKMAQYLSETFNAPEYIPAFLRIAWRLDDGTIHRLAGMAKEVGKTNPRGYFIASAKNEMAKRGIM